MLAIAAKTSEKANATGIALIVLWVSTHSDRLRLRVTVVRGVA
jgi:hypothetical protein